jgi:hypothetical protein
MDRHFKRRCVRLIQEDAKRSLSTLEEAEEAQLSVIAKIAREGLPDRVQPPSPQAQAIRKNDSQPQFARFAGKRVEFRDHIDVDNINALALLNTHAQKVKGQVVRDCFQLGHGDWEVTLSLVQFGRHLSQGRGRAACKQAAANLAATSLLEKLAK